MCLSALIFLPSCLLRNLSWLSYFSAGAIFGTICAVLGTVAALRVACACDLMNKLLSAQ